MRRYAQSGFTLLEALIALLVLSIGLLGVAAMQLRALQSAHMGYQRAVVSLAAIDAQERAWAGLSQSSPRACPESSTFDSAWAAHWLADILVDTGNSEISSSGNCEYSVSIEWAEGRYSSGESGSAFVYQFRLPEL